MFDRPSQVAVDTDLSIARSANGQVRHPQARPYAQVVVRVGTQPVGRGRPNALWLAVGVAPIHLDPDPGHGHGLARVDLCLCLSHGRIGLCLCP